MPGGDASQRLARPGPEIEDAIGVHLGRGVGDDELQRFVLGHLGSHHVEVGDRVEMELVGHACLRRDTTDRPGVPRALHYQPIVDLRGGRRP